MALYKNVYYYYIIIYMHVLLMMCFAHLQVKKVLSQTIIAMAHHGYLEIEGGQLMIDFVVRQCALPTDTVSCRHGVDNDAAVVCVHDRGVCGIGGDGESIWPPGSP